MLYGGGGVDAAEEADIIFRGCDIDAADGVAAAVVAAAEGIGFETTHGGVVVCGAVVGDVGGLQEIGTAEVGASVDECSQGVEVFGGGNEVGMPGTAVSTGGNAPERSPVGDEALVAVRMGGDGDAHRGLGEVRAGPAVEDTDIASGIVKGDSGRGVVVGSGVGGCRRATVESVGDVVVVGDGHHVVEAIIANAAI